jgi:hypothetical protein
LFIEGVLFLSYDIGFGEALPHLRKNFRQLQKTWKLIVDDRINSPKHNSGLEVPTPTNSSNFDGGKWNQRLKYPLELPHVLLLPLTSYEHSRPSDGRLLDLPGFKTDVVDRKRQSFVIHSKKSEGACTNNKCWPFVV